MTTNGPRFLDGDDEEAPLLQPLGRHVEPTAADAPPSPPMRTLREPLLLAAETDAPAHVDVGWMPSAIVASPVRTGTASWVAAGLGVLVASWAALSLLSFWVALWAQSLLLGIVGVVSVGLGCLLLLYATVLELRAYRALGTVARLRAVFADGATSPDQARDYARRWLDQVGAAIAARAAVERLLRSASTTAEIRSVLRSQVADPLREQAMAIGRQAAMQGATLVAVCPHPAWDGIIAGGRGLLVVRRVAMLHGLRPSLAVTLALLRRIAWTAAGTAGLTLISQRLADHVIDSTPVLKHVAAALPGSGVVAARLYRLASVTAETCSPIN